MKKIILFLSITTAMILTSCSGSDDAPSTTDVLLKKIIVTEEDEVETTNFTYNGNKISTAISDDGFKQQFTYTGDLITKIEIFSDNALEGTDTYEYNSDKQLVTFKAVIAGENFGTKETYVYNANGSVSVSKFIGNATTQTELVETRTISFENGEISTIQSGDNIIRFTYDAKNNPLRNVTGLSRIAYADGEAIGIVHNIIKKEFVGSGLAYSTQFTYNTNNYPATSTESSTSDGEPPVVTQYFY